MTKNGIELETPILPIFRSFDHVKKYKHRAVGQ